MGEDPSEWFEIAKQIGLGGILFFVLKMVGQGSLWFGNHFIIPVKDRIGTFLDDLSESVEKIRECGENHDERLTQISSILDNNREKELKNLREKVYLYENNIQKLQRNIQDHSDNLSFIESYCENLPTPVWYKILDKDRDFTMAFINKAYEQYWHVSKQYYKGKKDKEVWGDDTAEKFAKADLKVMKFKKAIPFIEEVPREPGDDKTAANWLVWKFPIFRGIEVVGVGGMALDIDTICTFDAPKVRKEIGFDDGEETAEKETGIS